MIYIPVWKRSPNKFIKYDNRPFTLPPNAYGIAKRGVETMAIFKDKNNRGQEMQAFIRWLDD